MTDPTPRDDAPPFISASYTPWQTCVVSALLRIRRRKGSAFAFLGVDKRVRKLSRRCAGLLLKERTSLIQAGSSVCNGRWGARQCKILGAGSLHLTTSSN